MKHTIEILNHRFDEFNTRGEFGTVEDPEGRYPATLYRMGLYVSLLVDQKPVEGYIAIIETLWPILDSEVKLDLRLFDRMGKQGYLPMSKYTIVEYRELVRDKLPDLIVAMVKRIFKEWPHTLLCKSDNHPFGVYLSPGDYRNESTRVAYLVNLSKIMHKDMLKDAYMYWSSVTEFVLTPHYDDFVKPDGPFHTPRVIKDQSDLDKELDDVVIEIIADVT